MAKNPWKIIDSSLKYENPWIKVEHHDVLNPAGNQGIYGTVHFHNLAIGILPIDKNGNTWLVGQYRFPLKQFSWEIPEGGGKHGINPLETAKRELLEETGIKAKNWSELIRIHTSNSVTDELGIIYLAEDLSIYSSNPDEDEVLEIKKIPFNEALAMVLDGTITDSLSIAAILRYQVYLTQKNSQKNSVFLP